MHRCESLNISVAVEELSLYGEVSLGRCSKSTAYRNVKRVNEYLEADNCDWRVVLKADKEAHEYLLMVE